jgi:hypothetical protein
VTQGGPVPAQQVGVVLQRLGDRLRSLRVRLPELPDLHQPFPGQFHDPPTSPSWKRTDAGSQTASTCRGSEAPGAASPAKNACLRTSVLTYLTAYACGAGRRREAAAPGCAEYVAQMRAMAGSLGGLREDAIPVDLREAVLAAFRDLPTR